MAQQIQDYVEVRRIARMSHEPSDGPDEMVVKSFLPLNGIPTPAATPFPTLRPNSQVDRQQQLQQVMGVRPPSNAQQHHHQVHGRRGGAASSLSVSGAGRTTSPSTGPTMTPIGTAATSSRPAKERIVLPPPSSRWYPAKATVRPILGEAVDPSVPASLESPRAQQRASQRKEISQEVQSHFLVNPPPGVGGKKRKSSARSPSVSSPSSPQRGASAGGSRSGGGGGGKKKGVLQPATAIPSTTAAIALAVKAQAEAASAGQPYVPSNLKSLMAVIRSFMDDFGRLNPVSFTRALRDLGVSDASTADNIFRRLESRGSPGYVYYGTVIAAFHEVINGPATQDILVNACFNLFDLDNRGYVHREHLAELKLMRVTLRDHPMCTPHMVKVLTDLFNDIKLKEEEHYINVVIRKGKKTSTKKPPQLKSHQNSVIPVERSVVQHMDRALFASYFATHRELVLAFAPRWIPLMDTNDDVGVAASEAMMRYENPPTPRRDDTQDLSKGEELSMGESTARGSSVKMPAPSTPQ